MPAALAPHDRVAIREAPAQVSHCSRLQTKRGSCAQGLPASEFAAFLDQHILPTLRRHHEGPTFEADCRAFARDELHLPEHLWELVQLPAYVSLDNATAHVRARKMQCTPRMPQAAIDRVLRERYQAQFGAEAPSTWSAHQHAPQPTPTTDGPAAGLKAALGRSGRRAQRAEPPAEDAAQPDADVRLRDEMQRNLERWRTQNGGKDWVRHELRKLADERPEARVLLPHQFMPLAPVTPDIHCAIEHLVGTVKTGVRSAAWDVGDCEELLSAKLWQGLVTDRLRQLNTGGWVQRHMRSSWRKQRCICQILRTPKGQSVVVYHTFGEAGRQRGEDASGSRESCAGTPHTVRGTGGAWIANSKWG